MLGVCYHDNEGPSNASRVAYSAAQERVAAPQDPRL
jgi:hypothetical protein